MSDVRKYLVVGASSDVGMTYIREFIEDSEKEGGLDQVDILAHYAHDASSLEGIKNEYPSLNLSLVQGDFCEENSTKNFVDKVVEWGCPDVMVYLPASRFEYMKLKIDIFLP